MRVKWSQRWSRAAPRRSIVSMARAYGLVTHAARSIVHAVVEDARGLDPDDQAVDRRVERLAVVAQRELVDVLAGALLVQLDRALDLEVLVRVLAVPDADADERICAQVPAFGALVRRVEDHILAV